MAEISLFRLYALRAVYLLIAVGLGSDVWPAMFHHKPWDLWHGVACSMLAALSALSLLGLRYPLKMLPLLFLEMAWKTIWLVGIALPLWSGHQPIDANTAETIKACLMVVIVPIIFPWRYVAANYLAAQGDRWTSRGAR